ncbi:hypothetical protein [Candidatus Entotheonella palauensis]|uniref:hypothetical protein n=1 Tax=Candidatus Entotheonella palauensis TaxID=93172 RepID=UPI000B7CDB1C|nr:hypothetical protein [Candidatus Entotheonella palauensis]
MGITSMLSNIFQGPIHKHLDAQLNHCDAQGGFDRRAEILSALQDPAQDYIRILKELGHVPTHDASRVSEHWYDPNWAAPESPCWWKADQPLAPLVRQSLIHAIEVANEADLPIASYWMPIGEQCEVLIARSPAQVTRFIVTPLSLPQQTRRRQRPKSTGAEGTVAPIVRDATYTHLDALLNHRDAQGTFDRRDEILAVLQDRTRGYLHVLTELCQMPQAALDQALAFWYNANWSAPKSDCWWKAEQPIEPTLREGLMLAVRMAMKANLPIASYWLPDFDRCRVSVVDTEAQITHLVLTPPIPLPPQAWTQNISDAADLWVVKRGEVGAWEALISSVDASGPIRITQMQTAP